MRLTPRDAVMLGLGSLVPTIAGLITTWAGNKYLGA